MAPVVHPSLENCGGHLLYNSVEFQWFLFGAFNQIQCVLYKSPRDIHFACDVALCDITSDALGLSPTEKTEVVADLG